MKKILIGTLLLCLNYFGVKAQEVATQSVYVEFGGAGLPYSVNYDFRFDRMRID